ncbi:MAG: U32 family peptidase [Candidatus Firestonebacteria bacterium]|nr:U32 family peptidase [Candidatus Firestonebacteria bacterium]
MERNVEIVATAYTIEDVLLLKDMPVDVIRFGEPDCFYRALRNWPIENIEKVIEILNKEKKDSHFQFLNSPGSMKETEFLIKISRNFPDLTVVVETYGFLSYIKNKKVAGINIPMYNNESLKMLGKYNIKSISLSKNVKEEEIKTLSSIIKKEGYPIVLEYCFYGRDRLLSSWQCFLQHLAPQTQLLNKDCTNICNNQELILYDKDNSDIKYSITGNTIVSAGSNDRINTLGQYIKAGITSILLDFYYENIKSKEISNIVHRTKKSLEEYESEKQKQN